MTRLATQTKAQRIEDRLNVDRAGQIQVSNRTGGMMIQSMSEVMEVAKLMALSDIAVPRHLRENPGACLAICIRAHEWRMNPYAVADKSYVVNDRLSFESQLIHAVIEQRAPLQGRLRCRYSGEDGKRRCTVYAKIQGEEEPFEFQSAEFDKIQPKNSPLWKTKPDLQLFYNASRDWARMYFPDVILGVYAEDEIEAGPPQVSAVQRLNQQLEEPEKFETREDLHNKAFSASVSQQTANPSQSADESTPGAHPSARPVDSATDSSAGSREADAEEHQQPEAPVKDEQPAPKHNDSQDEDAATDESIDELVQQGEAQFKKALLAKARSLDGAVSKTACEGGVFKFITANGKGAEQWRKLWRAVAGGRFDFAKGVIQ